jgi:hypothetical protein
MPKQKIEIEVPDGYEVIEYRCLVKGDTFLNGFGEVEVAYSDTYRQICFPILRKTERWRPATPLDVCTKPKKARFRDTDKHIWEYSNLIGVQSRPTRLVWTGDHKNDFHYWQCEVLCD